MRRDACRGVFYKRRTARPAAAMKPGMAVCIGPAPPEEDEEEEALEEDPPAAVLALLARDEAEDFAPLTAVEALDSKLEAAEPALEAAEAALEAPSVGLA